MKLDQGPKQYYSDAAISPYRAVVFGSDQEHVALAEDASALPLGLMDELGTSAAEKTCDVFIAGIRLAVAGGTISAGASLVPTTGGALIAGSAGDPAIGQALQDAVSGDIFCVQIVKHSIPA